MGATDSTFVLVALISWVALLPSVALFVLAVFVSMISRLILTETPLIYFEPDPSSTREAIYSSYLEAVRLCWDFCSAHALCFLIAISIAIF
jgi:hypothetical protein